MKSIAIVGKGGTGKTAITALIAKVLIEEFDYKLLLIDADPTHPHLSHLMDLLPDTSLEKIRNELIQISIKHEEELDDLAQTLDFEVYNAIEERKSFSLLYIGKPTAPGCFCPSNTLLRRVIESISKDFDLILIDCEAGLEQIHRKVIRSVELILIVSDMSIRSLETAHSIKKMANRFTNYRQLGVILNKVRGNTDILLEKMEELDLPLFGTVPEDETILEFEMNGKPLIHIPSNDELLSDIRPIVQKIVELKE
jgi:CO dehydrogenase maturation factor